MKTVFKILTFLAVAYFGYDYYEIRQQAMCAHATVEHTVETK